MYIYICTVLCKNVKPSIKKEVFHFYERVKRYLMLFELCYYFQEFNSRIVSIAELP